MVGFFDGSLTNVWDPTPLGDYQFHGEDPKNKKGYVPRADWDKIPAFK